MDKTQLSSFYNKLDRSFFIDSEYKNYANFDEPLPIGHGQTISQPSLVYDMTLMLDPDLNSKVLEVGTGSGYQTALLAEFSASVYTIERIPDFSEKAKAKLDSLGYRNIFYKTGDGSEGWSENSPYDRIIVTAAAKEVPEDLLKQLGFGGRMIIPVGPEFSQKLLLITKDVNGIIQSKAIEEVRFVELKGKYGWRMTT